MGYIRQVIRNLTDKYVVKQLNDNFELLWKKVFGDLYSEDLRKKGIAEKNMGDETVSSRVLQYLAVGTAHIKDLAVTNEKVQRLEAIKIFTNEIQGLDGNFIVIRNIQAENIVAGGTITGVNFVSIDGPDRLEITGDHVTSYYNGQKAIEIQKRNITLYDYARGYAPSGALVASYNPSNGAIGPALKAESSTGEVTLGIDGGGDNVTSFFTASGKKNSNNCYKNLDMNSNYIQNVGLLNGLYPAIADEFMSMTRGIAVCDGVAWETVLYQEALFSGVPTVIPHARNGGVVKRRNITKVGCEIWCSEADTVDFIAIGPTNSSS